ncbi:MAG: hypothetical protein AVDCRST_MAG89-3457 [uncultured Gemmatimonadetes bacterium]|uniref:Uncharacterized protein n=1 Tax=uncultured Gemmatimonadota bacterium TaxID=203437 RepID=A0A6J4MFL0_9BACT|nr:MAG: hypothetical protein AVDCRST_MAG89-3457 [uncultured Gemmatimonadota bacterium]
MKEARRREAAGADRVSGYGMWTDARGGRGEAYGAVEWHAVGRIRARFGGCRGRADSVQPAGRFEIGRAIPGCPLPPAPSPASGRGGEFDCAPAGLAHTTPPAVRAGGLRDVPAAVSTAGRGAGVHASVTAAAPWLVRVRG